MVTYNLTNLAINNVSSLVQVTNTASNGLLVGLFMLAIFLVLLMTFLRWGVAESIATSGFVCFILSLFLVYLDLMSMLGALAFLIASALAVLYMYLD